MVLCRKIQRLSGKWTNIKTKREIQIKDELGIATSFSASKGWFEKFKRRRNISLRQVCGESADVSTENVDEWLSRLPTVCRGYHASDIFNMNETGLFYRMLPSKTLSTPGSCRGGKLAKERTTVAFCVSATGEKNEAHYY